MAVIIMAAEPFASPDRRGRRTAAQRRPSQPASSLLAFALLLGGAAAAIFLAGGAEQGNLGVYLLSAGAALLIAPARARVPVPVALAAVAFLLCSGASLLPARFFHVPVWREHLAAVPDLPLPDTVSAAPGQTLFWLAILGLSVVTGLFSLTQPMRSRDLLALGAVGVTVCGAYTALSIFAKLSGWIYPFAGGATFGFLPNRNHTATLLITGSILAVGVLTVAFRERRWLVVDLAVAGLALCVTGLFFFSESRAGVLFLCLGTLGWLVGLGRQHRRRPLLLSVVAVVVVAGGLFLGVESEARNRLLHSMPRSATWKQVPDKVGASPDLPKPGGQIPSDDRLRIYRDTFAMIRDVPLTGTGLGTFSLVFPQYRQASASVNTILHPESDWLMIAAETGLPALVCLCGLGALILRGWRPASAHPYWPLRWAFLTAAGTATAHGLVDVPGHRAALGWWVLGLAGLALQPGRIEELSTGGPNKLAGWKTRSFFVVNGCFSLCLGAQLVRAEWFGGHPLPPEVAWADQQTILRLYQQAGVSVGTSKARAAVQTSPLVPALYYQLGVLLMKDTDNDAETDRTFLLQRLLDPVSPDVPRTQGAAWMPFEPARTATLFTMALERQDRLRTDLPGRAPSERYLHGLVAQAALAPAVQRSLWPVAASRGPAYELAWLEGASSESVQEKLPGLVSDRAFIKQLSPEQKHRFQDVWSSKGDRDALRSFLAEEGADWQVAPSTTR